MKIIITESFQERLEKQVAFIAADSPSRSRKFKNDLITAIRKILLKPFKHRQSIYFNDPCIRDLIFKGYTVVFRINQDNDVIEVFSFVKYQEKLTE
jgi:plasmid stabilization system protein ParE